LLDLRDKLQEPQTYLPTTYHWLLMYECLSFHIECLNDAPGPQVLAALKASQALQDASYLVFLHDGHGREGVAIDFEAFIDTYFWDTDFLLDASAYAQLGAPVKQQLGFRADVFGVVWGLRPHQVVLKTVEEVEATGLEGADGHGELS
jgi:hypothetical protein